MAEESRKASGGLIAVEVPEVFAKPSDALGSLSDTCNKLLAIASVIGREFYLQTIVRLAEVDLTECIGELETVVQSGILQGVESGYRYTHAVTGNALRGNTNARKTAVALIGRGRIGVTVRC